MEREKILALYSWTRGVCFRHPGRGETETTVVKTIRPRGDGEHLVRACRDCVCAIEAIREDAARDSGSRYEPGHAGEVLE